jgi:hypothetical protein
MTNRRVAGLFAGAGSARVPAMRVGNGNVSAGFGNDFRGNHRI